MVGSDTPENFLMEHLIGGMANKTKPQVLP